jgi:hypothetical protein
MSTEDKKEAKVLEVEKTDEVLKTDEKPKKTKLQGVPKPLLQGVERRIAKLNAYRALLHHRLTMKGTPPDIKKEIEHEFYLWAEDRMLVHMGEYEENRIFTDGEIEALKNLAAKVMATAQGTPPPPNPQAPINPPPQPPPQQRRVLPQPPNPNAQSLRESMTMGEIKQRDRQTGNYLQKLEQMDQRGPEF